MLFNVMPKIEDAIRRGKTAASFQVTAKFRVGKSGGVDVTLSQTASIPMDNVTMKLSYNSGQLSLFEAVPPSERARTTTSSGTPSASGGATTASA
jgi:hypothetical protein